jgi:hypothetical protein
MKRYRGPEEDFDDCDERFHASQPTGSALGGRDDARVCGCLSRSVNEMADPRITDIADRCVRVLGKSTDLTLVVLRSHLLLEEQLRFLLDRVMRKPEFLDNARLTFAQQLTLAQAILGAAENEYPWPLIKSVNTLRNKLSHSAEVEDLEASVYSLLQLVPARISLADGVPMPAYRFTMAIAHAVGSLRGAIYAFLGTQRLDMD